MSRKGDFIIPRTPWLLAPATAKYIRHVAISAYGDSATATMSELDIIPVE